MILVTVRYCKKNDLFFSGGKTFQNLQIDDGRCVCVDGQECLRTERQIAGVHN